MGRFWDTWCFIFKYFLKVVYAAQHCMLVMTCQILIMLDTDHDVGCCYFKEKILAGLH